LRRPNILLLYTDQQRWDALGANGNDYVRTPNLDSLAGQGANFDRCFVQAAVCMPSRMSFLTGQYPSKLGIVRNGAALPQGVLTLGGILRNYGYIGANIGKLHFLPHSRRDHREVHPAYGFDHLEISDEPGCYEDAYRAWVRRKAPDQLGLISLGLPEAAQAWRRQMGIDEGISNPERLETRPIAFRGRSDVTHSAFVAEQTIEFVRARRHRPFFCVAGFFSPHPPLVAPREFLDMYDPEDLPVPAFAPELDRSGLGPEFSDRGLRLARQGYYAMISEVDHHVGRILAALDELGLAEDTIVVFTSDHGDWLGERLRYGKGYPGDDCITRVPLIVRYPQAVPAGGQAVHHIVEAIDVLPTLLGWAGIPVPDRLQGRRLPLDGLGEPRRSAITEGPGWKALRTDKLRYVLKADGTEELHDLAAEFGQYRNVARDRQYAEALSQARLEMARRMIDDERMLPRTAAY